MPWLKLPRRSARLWYCCMRPTLLDPFFASITSLPGIGPKVEKLYRRLLGREDEPRIVDLLFHLPVGAIDRRARPKLQRGRTRHRSSP